MNMTGRVFRSLPKLLAVAAFGVSQNNAHATGHGGGGGHGGGAGHVGAFHGGHGYGGYGYGRGFYGHPYGYYGYPYGYYGFGVGLGFGYGFGYGYGSGYGGYNYYGYPYYGSGYGYPYYAGYPGGYGGYGNYGGYGVIPSTPGGPDPYYGSVLPYGHVNPTYGPGGPPPNGTGGPAAPQMRSADSEVALVVRVPENATVWVNGVKTTQTGLRREFVSGGLNPGRSYTFVVRARWVESDGNVVDNDRRLTVQSGERRAIDFGAPQADPAPIPLMVKP